MSNNPDNARQRSWIETANQSENGFPLPSLPYCAFTSADAETHLGVGIGDFVLDVSACAANKLISAEDASLRLACESASLNNLIELGPRQWAVLRREVTALLHESSPPARQAELRPYLLPMHQAKFALPVLTTGYSDFYASREHAFRVGKLFRPTQPLLPNFDWIPIGYHGRASSIVVSGTPVRRPNGQQMLPGASTPVFQESQQLDYEVELAAYVGVANRLGHPVPIAHAEEHIFGYSLLNDWSARDIQSWEYQPLGPFLGKNFATSVSPWVIPSAALQPYRLPMTSRESSLPAPLPYLAEPQDATTALDVKLEALILTQRMREAGLEPHLLSQANAKSLFWSFAQMLTHHTSNGCNLRIGDILASGTISGSTPGTEGCLLERTRRGAELLHLPGGEERAFLEDGDEIILRGWSEREGMPRISFGECRGMVLPAA